MILETLLSPAIPLLVGLLVFRLAAEGEIVMSWVLRGRGRTTGYPAPPVQIPAGGIIAQRSFLIERGDIF